MKAVAATALAAAVLLSLSFGSPWPLGSNRSSLRSSLPRSRLGSPMLPRRSRNKPL